MVNTVYTVQWRICVAFSYWVLKHYKNCIEKKKEEKKTGIIIEQFTIYSVQYAYYGNFLLLPKTYQRQRQFSVRKIYILHRNQWMERISPKTFYSWTVNKHRKCKRKKERKRKKKYLNKKLTEGMWQGGERICTMHFFAINISNIVDAIHFYQIPE